MTSAAAVSNSRTLLHAGGNDEVLGRVPLLHTPLAVLNTHANLL